LNIIKAVCECKNTSEDDLIVAVRCERFYFLETWDIWIWTGVVILSI